MNSGSERKTAVAAEPSPVEPEWLDDSPIVYILFFDKAIFRMVFASLSDTYILFESPTIPTGRFKEAVKA